MRENEPPQSGKTNPEEPSPRADSDPLGTALVDLIREGKAQLFWDKLQKLEASDLGRSRQFALGIRLIRKRVVLGEGVTIAPLSMAMVGESVSSGIEAQHLEKWVVNYILDEIERQSPSSK